ncbi:hypothetical protein FBQ81_00505 [Chloroflexi bacterium CFX6]|nr:hypothetical protein [Chloroflexi bacterium CFX6]
MAKQCFLIGQKNSLFQQLVASLLTDMADDLDLYENKTFDFDSLLDEIREAKPDMILLEEEAPFLENSLMIHLLTNVPNLPVIVISEDSNQMHVIRCRTRLLSSSRDLIEVINLIKAEPSS